MADEIKKSIKIEVDSRDLTNLANSIDLFNTKIKTTMVDVDGNTTTLMNTVAESINFLKNSLDQYESNANTKALNRLNIYKQIESIYRGMKEMDPSQDLKVKESATAINANITKAQEAYLKQLENISISNSLYKPGAALRIPSVSALIDAGYTSTTQRIGAKQSYLQSISKSYDPRIAELEKKGDLTESEQAQLTELKSKKELADAAFASLGKSATWAGVIASIAQTIVKFVGTIVKTFSEVTGLTFSIKDNFKEITNVSKDLLQSALTANQATSLFSDSASRNRQLTYGLSAAQSYAMSQTMGILNMKSDEDLLFMNATQANLFNEFMQKYENFYTKLESSGTLTQIQEMQLDLKLMRQEIAIDLIEWISKNKDSIINAAKTFLKLSEVLLTALVKIGEFFGAFTASSITGVGYGAIASSDAVATSSSLSNRTVIQNVNLTMNNSAELANSDNELKSFFNDQGEQLIKQLSLQLGES